jgi:ATP-dependent RNA helicase SUPV3L1/SUV3
MMSLLGCSPEELSGVLKALGFRLERRPIKKEEPATAATEATPLPPSDAEAPGEPKGPATAEAVTTVEAPPAPTPAEASGEVVATEAAAKEPVVTDDTATVVSDVEVKEPSFEEIWRPRRHARGEHRKEGAPRGRRRSEAPQRNAQPPAEKAAAPPSANGNGAERRAPGEGRGGYVARDKGKIDRDRDSNRDQGAQPASERHARRGKGFDKKRQDDRRKPEVHSAAPPRRVAMDADSPFAALGALRDELAKRGKESSST